MWHQVEAESQDQLDVSDVGLLLGSQLLLLLLLPVLLVFLGLSEVAGFTISVFQVGYQQGVRHLALVEERVQLSQIGVVELLVSRKVFPEGELLPRQKFLVLPLLLELVGCVRLLVGLVLLHGQVHRALDQVLVEGFEVQVNLPNELFREVFERVDDILFDL